MSITISGLLTQSTLLRGGVFEDAVSTYRQSCIHEAAIAGLAFLVDHTPVASGNLVATAAYGENQYSVWFMLAGTLTDYETGLQKPYGYAQEFGWHDRGGGWHEGHHMVEDAGRVAAEAYMAFAGGNAMAIFKSPVLERFTSAGDFGAMRNVTL